MKKTIKKTKPDAKQRHRQRHVELHRAFDELMADYLAQHRGKTPSNTTLTELMEWSHQQTIKPDERET